MTARIATAAWLTCFVDALTKAIIGTIIACEINLEKIVFEEFHECATDIAREIVDHHNKSAH